jgi:hypothetical protein
MSNLIADHCTIYPVKPSTNYLVASSATGQQNADRAATCKLLWGKTGLDMELWVDRFDEGTRAHMPCHAAADNQRRGCPAVLGDDDG